MPMAWRDLANDLSTEVIELRQKGLQFHADSNRE